MTQPMRFLEWPFNVSTDGSIDFEDLPADKLDARNGDMYECHVNAETNEVTLKKVKSGSC